METQWSHRSYLLRVQEFTYEFCSMKDWMVVRRIQWFYGGLNGPMQELIHRSQAIHMTSESAYFMHSE